MSALVYLSKKFKFYVQSDGELLKEFYKRYVLFRYMFTNI